MAVTKKNHIGKPQKIKMGNVMVTYQEIDAKDTLFPEKLAEANEILRNTKFNDPILRSLTKRGD